MPGSRSGRETPVTTNSNALLESLEVALASLMLPSVWAVTTPWATLTRMPSRRSSESGRLPAPASAAVISTGAGSGMPLPSTTTPGETISVVGVAAVPRNSSTVPVTRTLSPTATMFGAAEVNTKMPSEVAALPSMAASPVAANDCRKKPLPRLAVTTPSVITSWPSRADSSPLPWIAPIELMTMSSLVIVPVPLASPMAAFADGLLRVTRKVSLISRAVSPVTSTLRVVLVAPLATVAVPLVAMKSTLEVAESLLVA